MSNFERILKCGLTTPQHRACFWSIHCRWNGQLKISPAYDQARLARHSVLKLQASVCGPSQAFCLVFFPVRSTFCQGPTRSFGPWIAAELISVRCRFRFLVSMRRTERPKFLKARGSVRANRQKQAWPPLCSSKLKGSNMYSFLGGDLA